MTKTIEEIIEFYKVVPVIAIPNQECIIPLGDALVSEQLPIIEITFRTQWAAEAIRTLSQNKDLYVGAGTVLNCEQAEIAIQAGAKFIVSPGFSEKVVQFCLDRKIAVYPGVITPTEIQQALALGLRALKFFPAESFGGLKVLKAYESPFHQVRFIPTGGIGLSNLLEYLKSKNVLACGGTWIAPVKLLETGDFALIHENIRQTVAAVKKLVSSN